MNHRMNRMNHNQSSINEMSTIGYAAKNHYMTQPSIHSVIQYWYIILQHSLLQRVSFPQDEDRNVVHFIRIRITSCVYKHLS